MRRDINRSSWRTCWWYIDWGSCRTRRVSRWIPRILMRIGEVRIEVRITLELGGVDVRMSHS